MKILDYYTNLLVGRMYAFCSKKQQSVSILMKIQKIDARKLVFQLISPNTNNHDDHDLVILTHDL